LAEYIKTAFPLPAISSGTEYGRFRPCHANAKRPDHDPIYTTARAGRGRSLHRPGRYDLGAAFSGVLVNVERKLGLYQAMADLGACTSVALAA
jgi:hypothetical protein